MKPIKPKYVDSVKVDWKISKKAKTIVSLYSKYTKYDESEIVDKILVDILEDTTFVEWLKSRRYQKKINDILSNNCDVLETIEEMGYEEIEETGDTE